jgi:RNA polymerase sigma-54 factor
MKMNFNLNLSQPQKLVMTHELKQAIEILQYNSIELNEFINEELLNNPIIEKPTTEEKSHDEIDWKSLSNEMDRDRKTYNNVQAAEDVNYDNFVAGEDTLNDFLKDQLKFTLLSDEQMEVALYIIENLDENGFLDLSNDEIGIKYNKESEEIESIIDVLQNFEPAGVVARSLKECLLIQACKKGVGDILVFEIIENFLDDLGNNRLNNIAKKLKVDIEAVKSAALYISTLEPKPGREFSSMRDIRYIKPDVVVEKIDGEYVILVNDFTAPKLNISNYYRKLLNDVDTTKDTSEYINTKLNQALKLIKSIEQRRNTIFRVVEAILDYQYEFFEKGKMYLKTLNLKDIANEIGVHESTVSRAVNGKYMQCSSGLYEIKYFFQSGVSSASGEGVSSQSIKDIISEMIAEENTKKPLSDQIISTRLKDIGVKVSRRTVAKYRDELGIPSSSKRKAY